MVREGRAQQSNLQRADTAPAASPSDHIPVITGTTPPQILDRPCADHSSAHSPIGAAGVMG